MGSAEERRHRRKGVKMWSRLRYPRQQWHAEAQTTSNWYNILSKPGVEKGTYE